MKNLIAIFALSLTALAHAEDKAHPNFEKHKAEQQANIDERTGKLQELKTCLANAKDPEAAKACHATMKAWRQEHRAERAEQRKARIDERIKKLEERKAKHK